jgi:pilus assembly protein Flp/PilA
MPGYHVKARDVLARLRAGEDGLVSFEYVIVVACVIGAVASAFPVGGTSLIGTALSNAIAVIVTYLPTAA